RDALRQSQTDKEYIKNVVILEKMLIAIHPFLDGNGRTIRLLSDALYLKRKLPLPLHPRKDDFYKPTADLIEETFSLMQDYSNAYRK
ncbi:MAG: Fic family protein, partial [Bacteriovorax sp.]|nr:Fic family protein [Bacteriovorax sp.]